MKFPRAVALAGLLLLVLAGCDARMATGTKATDPPLTWRPSISTHWQIQLSGAFDAAVHANVYDLDPYATPAATVATIVAENHRAICHLDVGASDLSVPDASAFPASVLGGADGAGRRWLDIRDWTAIAPVLAERFDLCRTKGFQAVDADATDGYAEPTGFGLTMSDQLTFDANVAALARTYGLSIGIRTTPKLAAQVAPMADFTVVGGCFASSRCPAYFTFIQRGKAVYDVETGAKAPTFCPLAQAYGFSAITKPDPTMTAPVRSC